MLKMEKRLTEATIITHLRVREGVRMLREHEIGVVRTL